MTALHQLAAQYRALESALTEDGFDETTIADTIEASGIADDLATKLQNIVFVACNIVASVPAIEAEIERLQALQKAKIKKHEALLDYAKKSMEFSGVKKIDAGLMVISLQKNPDSVEITNAPMLPFDCMRIPEIKEPSPMPDRKMILQKLKAGEFVPGAELKQSTRIVIK
jgi:hypothetical protein